MKQQVKRKEKFGVFFWLAVISLAVIIILVNRNNISNTLEQSDIKKAFANRVQSDETEQQLSDTTNNQLDADQNNNQTANKVQDSIVTPLVDSLISDKTTSSIVDTVGLDDETIAKSDDQAIIATVDESIEQLHSDAETRVAQIYFVKVNDTGQITPQIVARTVPKTSAPLTQSIHTLLQGLTVDEIESGLLHLIPPQTQLLSATIQDGVAILNFTEHFRYNGYGEEGMIAQILQVVYSVTQFSNINSVKILIEGESIEFLNSDSFIYLGQPINRDSISFS